MFRIEFFVDDKMLAAALRGVAGKVRGLQVVPVVNAVEGDGKPAKSNGHAKPVKAASGAGDYTDALVAYMRKHGIDTVDAKSGQDICGKLGASPASYSYFILRAVKRGLLKKIAKKGHHPQYQLVN